MSEPAFYQKNGTEIAAAKARLKTIEQKLDEAYQRWEILDMKAGNVPTED
jgi:hypothetical protein